MVRRTIKGMLVGLVFFTSCYYDVEELLYPNQVCNTSNMSYQSNILPIIDTHCYQCHSNATAPDNDGITLDGYAEVKKYVDNEKLLGVIRHDPGFSEMPKNGSKLSDCNIAKIEQWVADGAPDN